MWLLYVWRKSKREGGTGRGSGEMQEVKKKIRKVEQRRECEVDVVGMEMGEWKRRNEAIDHGERGGKWRAGGEEKRWKDGEQMWRSATGIYCRWWRKVSGDRMISPRGTEVIFLYSHTAERFMCPEVREIERKKALKPFVCLPLTLNCSTASVSYQFISSCVNMWMC